MLLLPMDRAFDWRRPPVVTLLLIVINTGCFLLWQSGDDQAVHRALAYYSSSGLLETEYPHFRNHLRTTGRLDELPGPEEAEQAPDQVFYLMLDEGVFLQRLEDGRVIRRFDHGYRNWRAHRDRFEEMLDGVVFLRYGWKAAQPDWQSLFGHMFLHADLFHLLGNMVFLLAVGFLVESVLAGWVFLLCYLLVGVGAAGLDSLLRAESLIPGIGASGAISGVMGMYAVLFWRRSVRVFYFLFVYFDSVRLPAITLLPLWIGNELYQMWSHPESNINFVAHLGGLFSGALVGWMARGTAAFDMQPIEQQDQLDDFEERMQAARQLCEQQDFKSALPRLRSLYRDQPDNQQVLYHLFMAERLYPDSDQFHQVSLRILAQPTQDPAWSAMAHDVLLNYAKLARPEPRISNELACSLLGGFQRPDQAQAARLLQRILQERGVGCADLPGVQRRSAR